MKEEIIIQNLVDALRNKYAEISESQFAEVLSKNLHMSFEDMIHYGIFTSTKHYLTFCVSSSEKYHYLSESPLGTTSPIMDILDSGDSFLGSKNIQWNTDIPSSPGIYRATVDQLKFGSGTGFLLIQSCTSVYPIT